MDLNFFFFFFLRNVVDYKKYTVKYPSIVNKFHHVKAREWCHESNDAIKVNHHNYYGHEVAAYRVVSLQRGTFKVSLQKGTLKIGLQRGTLKSAYKEDPQSQLTERNPQSRLTEKNPQNQLEPSKSAYKEEPSKSETLKVMK